MLTCSFEVFRLILGFLNRFPPIVFLILSEFWRWRLESIALYPNSGRHIRTILRFTEKEAEGQNKRSHCPSTLYPNFWSALRSRKAPFGCFKSVFWIFHKNVLGIF